MTKVLIIIPAYNEEQNIEKVVDNIISNYPQYDYIIVNDGSTDNTEGVCRQRGYRYVTLPLNLGIGGAVQTGYRFARDNDYDIAIQIDGDGQHDISYAAKLIEEIEAGNAEMCIGSRYITKEGFQSTAVRRMGINFLSGLIKLCTWKHIKDVTSGFRAVNRRFIGVFADDYPLDYPEPETIVSVMMHKGKVKEVPVIMNERENGTSSISFWKSIYYMIKVSIAVIICRISFGIRR